MAVAVDGSLYRFHPHFHDLMMEKTEHLVNPGIKVSCLLSSDLFYLVILGAEIWSPLPLSKSVFFQNDWLIVPIELKKNKYLNSISLSSCISRNQISTILKTIYFLIFKCMFAKIKIKNNVLIKV